MQESGVGKTHWVDAVLPRGRIRRLGCGATRGDYLDGATIPLRHCCRESGRRQPVETPARTNAPRLGRLTPCRSRGTARPVASPPEDSLISTDEPSC